MAVPSSGELSLGKIRNEIENNDYDAGPYIANETNLKSAETGVYGAINTDSDEYPDGIVPFAMSEWYLYDHDASGTSEPLDLTFSGIAIQLSKRPTFTGVLISNVGKVEN